MPSATAEGTDDNAELMAALLLQTQQFRLVLDNITQGACLFDRDRRLVLSNRRYAEIYGLRPEQIRPGMSLQEIIALRATVGAAPRTTVADYVRIADNAETVHSVTGAIFELQNGRVVAIRHQPMPDGGYVATHEDITERRQIELKLAHVTHHDALTGLPNRAWLREALGKALGATGAPEPCALLCIGLDRFKDVNDTLGHAVGDLLLQAVAERLRAHLPSGQALVRLGGSEFAVLLPGCGEPGDAAFLAARLIRELAHTFVIDGHRVLVGASVGIAKAPQDATDADHLLRNAQLALHAAKTEGRGRFVRFEPRIDADAQHRRVLELELRHALAESQFELVYQPQVSLETDRITGFEALLRWRHPQRGTVPPADFIPLAEETGLIVPIGEWVLNSACREAAGWPADVQVAVNLSARQFRAAGLFEAVRTALRGSGLAPRRLELEITESALIEDWEGTRAILERIKRLGALVSLDDFGTGYSSLSYLRRFPFDRVKIDQYFIRELTRGDGPRAIVRAIVALCRALGIPATAEGVETDDQLAVLRAEHCNSVQGFLLSRPVPAAEVRSLLGSVPMAAHHAALAVAEPLA